MHFLVLLLAFSLLPFSSVSAVGEGFYDVRAGVHWAYPYVSDLVARGVISDGAYFRPDAPLNRAEMAKIVVTATTGIVEDLVPAEPSFPDVSTGEWFYQFIETAHLSGIARGYADGRFRPDQAVNRAEAIAFLVRAFGIPANSTTIASQKFRDVSAGVWYESELAAAFDANLVEGFRDSSGRYFRGNQFVNRAEMAKLVSVAIKSMKK